MTFSTISSPRHGAPAGRWVLALGALAPLGIGACSEEAGPPVARMEPARTELVLPPASTVTLETVWHLREPLGEPRAEPFVFVHLLGPEGELLRTFDHPFPEPWVPGTTVKHPIELWQSALATPLEPGRYTVTLGLVAAGTGRRWPLELRGTEGEAVGRMEYAVARVFVPREPEGPDPALGFEGGWHPVAPGTDRQDLAVRALAGEATIRFDSLTTPLVVELVLSIPDPEEAGLRLVMGPEGGSPSLELSSDCSGESVLASGPGTRRVQLRLDPPRDGTGCAVHLVPDFVLVDPASFQRTAGQLRRLTWSVAAGVPEAGMARVRAAGDG